MKIKYFILTNLLILIFLAGCGRIEPESSSLVSSETESPSLSEASQDAHFITKMYLASDPEGFESRTALPQYSIWSNENLLGFFDESASGKMTVTFQGTDYTGEYYETVVVNDTSYYSDYYEFDGGRFSVRRGESNPNLFQRYDFRSGDKKEADCINIAAEFVKEYLDTNQFSMQSDPTFEEDILGVYYKVLLEGIPVRSWCNVWVSSSGEIMMYTAQNIDEWNALLSSCGEEKIKEMAHFLTSEETEEQIIKECSAMYSEDASCKIAEQYFACLDNGQFSLISYVDTEFETENGEEFAVRDKILTIIE